jgi:hypothetical protein
MVEGIGPESCRQKRAFKKGAHSISNGLVGAFGAAILMRGVGAGELNIIAHSFASSETVDYSQSESGHPSVFSKCSTGAACGFDHGI